MKKIKPHGYWTPSRLLKEAQKYQYKIHFKKGNPSAHSTAFKNPVLFKQITSHMLNGNDKKSKDKIIHTVENVLIKANTCKTKSEFCKKFRKEYDALQKRGLIKELFMLTNFELENKCSSMGEISTISFLNKLLKINLSKKTVPWLGINRKK